MIDKVIRSVSKKLKSEYPDYKIILDYLEQNFDKVMFIQLMSVREQLNLSNRKTYKIKIQINIYNNKANNDFMRIGAKLYEILEIIELDDIKCRAKNSVFDIFNFVGRFLVTYEVTVNLNKAVPKMNKLSYRNGVK